jgi:hopanoid C-3 methylase
LRVLFVHPSPLMYSEIFLRLEPLGLERVAGSARQAGHEVRVLDLQVFSPEDLERALGEFQPEAVGFGLNYLANIPEPSRRSCRRSASWPVGSPAARPTLRA